jgi:hypothetical protein
MAGTSNSHFNSLSPERRLTPHSEKKMALHPNPVTLKMVASAKGRYVYPTLITWNGPGKLSLFEVRPKDRPGEPLPSGQPFLVTGQQTEGDSSSAWLTLNEREYALWEPEFAQRRRLSLIVKMGDVVEELDVKLTHVKIIGADFELILLDAAHAGANALAHLVHAVWSRLREVVPHRISSPVAQQKQAAPPIVVSSSNSTPSGGSKAEGATEYDQQVPTAPSVLPPPASERRGTGLNGDPSDRCPGGSRTRAGHDS